MVQQQNSDILSVRTTPSHSKFFLLNPVKRLDWGLTPSPLFGLIKLETGVAKVGVRGNALPLFK